MKVFNKKLVVVVLLIIEFSCCYLMYQSSKKNIDLAKVSYEEDISDSMFAMYIENDTGEYEEITNTNTFPEGYILNMDKTGCIDNKGNSVSDILTSKDDKVMVKSNKTVFCYLYFDKDNRVFAQVKRDYKNNTGALLLSETESDEYPVYYYNGDITNNNLLYGNFCWKMVRTTETGGVKLIYNGVPDEAEDGTLTCDNTGEESQIGTSAFNSNTNSLAYAGYMYNNIYQTSVKRFTSLNQFFEIKYYISDSFYYYGDTATWDGSKYVLSNKDGSEVTTYTWSDNYSNLVDKYTCASTNDKSCNVVSYIVGGTTGNMYYYNLSNGKIKDDYKIKIAPSVTDNGDGTYTLNEPIEVIKADYTKTHFNYKGYYYCNDLTSNTCGDMYYSSETSNISLTGYNMANIYKYGNSFEYKDGKYTLVDTIEFWNWPENYNALNNNHYTCFNTTGKCENIYYIYFTNNSSALYILISGGKNINDAINDMLYAENVNNINSQIKDIIDIWYENNLIDYTTYLENTIWCSSREIKDLGGWNPNGGNTASSYTIRFNSNALECINKSDQFTLKAEAGGTEGYGNNALDYPVGLLNAEEVVLATASGYLKSGSSYWLFSPSYYFAGAFNNYMNFVHSNGYLSIAGLVGNNGVRPAVSLSNKVEITLGDGSVSNPYQVVLPS